MPLLSLTVVSHSLTFDGAAVGAAFAVPGVASGSGVLGEWLLFGSGLVVGVCRFYMLYLVYLDCLPMLLSVPASCHCDRCFCHSPHAVRSRYIYVRTPRTVAALTSAFLRLRGVLLRTQAKCGACYQLIGACFVLSRLVRTGRSGHVYAPYARYGIIFFC
jgi:hypothetical protein